VGRRARVEGKPSVVDQSEALIPDADSAPPAPARGALVADDGPDDENGDDRCDCLQRASHAPSLVSRLTTTVPAAAPKTAPMRRPRILAPGDAEGPRNPVRSTTTMRTTRMKIATG